MPGNPWFPKAVTERAQRNGQKVGRRTSVRSLALLWLALVAILSPLGCEAEPTDSTGGETHFLRLCDDDPHACGTALACLCGVCTVPCQIQASCAAFPGARCVVRTGAVCGATTNVCEVACTTVADCAPLSAEHRCIDNTCRLPASEPPPPDDDGAAGSGPTTPPDTCPASTVVPNEVVILGDTFFALSHQITAYLEGLARDAGSLATGQRYRDHSRPTANALALSSTGLLDQYRDAAADAPVRVVIMNGGGADVLLGSCDDSLESCPVITAAAAAFDELLLAMATGGVSAVVFAGYPDPQLDGVRAKMDVLRPLLEASCVASPIPCHWVDLRVPFAGNYESYILADGISPTDAGSLASATAIWAALKDNCLAQ